MIASKPVSVQRATATLLRARLRERGIAEADFEQSLDMTMLRATAILSGAIRASAEAGRIEAFLTDGTA